jgi:hypothetical protein
VGADKQGSQLEKKKMEFLMLHRRTGRHQAKVMYTQGASEPRKLSLHTPDADAWTKAEVRAQFRAQGKPGQGRNATCESQHIQ